MFKWFILSEVLTSTQHFGQLAFEAKSYEKEKLENEVITKEETFLAIFNREDYLKIVRRNTGLEFKQKMDFLR